MDNNLHLAVIQTDGSFNIDRLVNWERNEARWLVLGGQLVAWQAVPLRWWDDASYIAYQCGDIED